MNYSVAVLFCTISLKIVKEEDAKWQTESKIHCESVCLQKRLIYHRHPFIHPLDLTTIVNYWGH